MAAPKKRSNFFETEEGIEILTMLRGMATNTVYNTESSYSANGEKHPDHLISFVEKHMNYLIMHPNLDAHQYLANLRLITRIK